MGIKSIKTLRNGKVKIETGSIQDAEILENSINDKLGYKIETHIQRPRILRLKIINITEGIPTDNIEDTLMAQNPEIGVGKREIIHKLTYETKRHTRNIVIEVSAQTRKKLIDNKVKIEWINCSIEDYVFPIRCFRCFDSTTV